jgi:dCMP deaminase
MSAKWDQHFLKMCLLTAEMSKDPSTKVGAVIVGPDREVRSTGFNGFPRGVLDLDARLLNREIKYSLIVHAEENAILNAARSGVSTRGCTLYVAAQDNTGLVWGGAPCMRCSVSVIQAGIVEVVAPPATNIPDRWKESIEKARDILEEAGLKYREVGL